MLLRNVKNSETGKAVISLINSYKKWNSKRCIFSSYSALQQLKLLFNFRIIIFYFPVWQQVITNSARWLFADEINHLHPQLPMTVINFYLVLSTLQWGELLLIFGHLIIFGFRFPFLLLHSLPFCKRSNGVSGYRESFPNVLQNARGQITIFIEFKYKE